MTPHREEARRLLGLDGMVSEPEVRRAYRRRAAQAHPDSQPVRSADSDTLFGGDELAQARFAQLRQASDLLMAYCRSQAESDGSFLIHIKRRTDDEELPHLRFAEVGLG